MGQGIGGGGPQVQGGFVGVLVHLLELGHHREDHVGGVEGDVRQEHGEVAPLHLGEDEQQRLWKYRDDVRQAVLGRLEGHH